MSEFKPKRRWLKFSLRTLFAIVTLCALAAGWLAYQFDWIRQRHRTLEAIRQTNNMSYGNAGRPDEPTAPWSISLFERGISWITVDPEVARNAQQIRELKRLFPEAEIVTPSDGLPVSVNRYPSWTRAMDPVE